MPVEFSSRNPPPVSTSPLAALKAKFTAFKAKVSSALHSIPQLHTGPVKSLQSRQVHTAPGPIASAIQGLKTPSQPADPDIQSAAFTDLARGLADAVKNADKSHMEASLSDLSQEIAALMMQPTLLSESERKLLKHPSEFMAKLSDAAIAATPEKDRPYVRDSLALLRQSATYKNAFPSAQATVGDQKQLLLAQHKEFDRTAIKTDVTLADLPADVTGSVEFKALMHDMAAVLGSDQSDAKKKEKLESVLLPRLQKILKPQAELSPKMMKLLGAKGISPAQQLQLVLGDGKAFMDSLAAEITKSAPWMKRGAVRETIARLGDKDGWRQLFKHVTANVGGTVKNFDKPNQERSITIGKHTYTFHSVLGSGAFGEVLLLKDPKRPQHPGLIAKVPKGVSYAQKIDGPAAEGRQQVTGIGTGAAAQNIAALEIPLVSPTGELILLMPLAANGSLKSVRENLDAAVADGIIDASMAAQLKLTAMVDLAKGLQHLDLAKGQQHFDIAERNVLVDQQGNTLISDFGLAETMEGNGPADATITPASPDKLIPTRWSSPERLLGKPTTIANDSWMFGAALWEVVYGKMPFSDMTPKEIVAMHAENRFDPTVDLPPIDTNRWPDGMHAQLRDLLELTLQPDPTKRLPMEDILRHPALTTGIIGTSTAKQFLAAVLAKEELEATTEESVGQYNANVSNGSGASAYIGDSGSRDGVLSSTAVTANAPVLPMTTSGESVDLYQNDMPASTKSTTTT